jgi:hypothetical protein
MKGVFGAELTRNVEPNFGSLFNKENPSLQSIHLHISTMVLCRHVTSTINISKPSTTKEEEKRLGARRPRHQPSSMPSLSTHLSLIPPSITL